jgi:hypothetical protein
MFLKLVARERNVVLFGIQLILIIYLLTSIYLYSLISVHWPFLDHSWQEQTGKMGETLSTTFLSWSRTRQCPAFLCQLPVYKCSFQGWLNAMFFSFLSFFLVVSLFTMDLDHNIEVLCTVPKDKNTVRCIMWKLLPVHAWAIVLLSMSSVLLNQQCKLSTVLSRSTHVKQCCYILLNWKKEKFDQRLTGV